MLDNKINSQDFINFCNETLDISGKIALAHFRDIRDLTIKVDESPVTLADKQIEQVIRREIEKKYQSVILSAKSLKFSIMNLNIHGILTQLMEPEVL